MIGKRALEERVARIGTAARSNTQRALNLLRTSNSSEQISMCASVGERKNEFASGRVEVEQYPAALDVAVAKSFKVAGSRENLPRSYTDHVTDHALIT